MSTVQTLVEQEADTVGEPDAAQYLTFMLDGEEYAVDILRVREIKGWEKATPIPNTPDYVQGVMNLRGTIVPVVDLRRRFGLAAESYGPTTVVIVLTVVHEERQRIMGIVVDAVSDTYTVAASEIKPAPDFGSGVDVALVCGLATVEEKLIILLDIDRLLSPAELVFNGDAPGESP